MSMLRVAAHSLVLAWQIPYNADTQADSYDSLLITLAITCPQIATATIRGHGEFMVAGQVHGRISYSSHELAGLALHEAVLQH